MSKKDMKKIANKISVICRKGKGAIYDYKKYIDEIIDDKKYWIFQDLLISKWNIDYTIFKDLDQLKEQTFYLIKKNTPTIEQEEIKNIFDENNTYQVGIDIFNNENVFLGSIFEDDILQEVDWYNDREMLEKKKQLFRFLVITKDNQQKIIDDPESSIIEKYEVAIKYLLT